MEMINLIFGIFNSPVFWMAGVLFLLGYAWTPKTSDDLVLAEHINELQTKKVDTDFHDTFILLTDTPGAYAGEGGKFVKVNAAPDALIFATIAWGDVSKAGSNLTDLATRAHGGLSDAPADAHHPQLHAASHANGLGDELSHDALKNFVGAEHLSLPNSMGNVINAGHTKALHDGLNIDADKVDGEEAAAIVTKARVDAVNCDADTVDGEEAAAIVTKARVDAVLLTIVGSGALAKNHGAEGTDMLVNVCYGVGAAPAVGNTTHGTIFLKYTA